jgi:SAM-dependent methyltransferase
MSDREQELIEKQISYYRRRAPEYDATRRPPGDSKTQPEAKLFAALDAFDPRGLVLELACGTGAWTRELVRFTDRLTALDSSPEMLELNRQRVADPRVRYIEADLFSWQPDRAYEVVVFCFWLSHVPLARFDDFWGLVESCLTETGKVFFADEGAEVPRKERFVDPERTVVERTLGDGSTHMVVKVFWDSRELEQRVTDLGWRCSVREAEPFYWGQARKETSS